MYTYLGEATGRHHHILFAGIAFQQATELGDPYAFRKEQMKLMEKGELSWTPCDDTRPHKFLPEMLFLKSILNTMALRALS